MSIVIQTVSKSGGGTCTNNNIRYYPINASIEIISVDDEQILVNCEHSAEFYNTLTSGTVTVSAGVCQVKYTTNGSNDYVWQSPSQTVSALRSAVVRSSHTLLTLQRTNAEQSVSYRIQLLNSVCGGNSVSTGTITIPPLKQNATNSNRRIVITVNGTKYEIENPY